MPDLFLIIILAWMLIGLAAALILGRSIRIADEKEGTTHDGDS